MAQEAGAWITLNWVIGEVDDVDTTIARAVVEDVLVGTPASPLRKALEDSRLGQGLAGIGLFNHVRQPDFSTGLRGIKTEDWRRVEALVEETLDNLVRFGIDPQMQLAALNSVGFQLREADFGAMPRGLALLWHNASVVWVHGGNPLAQLAFERPLAVMGERLRRKKATSNKSCRST